MYTAYCSGCTSEQILFGSHTTDIEFKIHRYTHTSQLSQKYSGFLMQMGNWSELCDLIHTIQQPPTTSRGWSLLPAYGKSFVNIINWLLFHKFLFIIIIMNDDIVTNYLSISRKLLPTYYLSIYVGI